MRYMISVTRELTQTATVFVEAKSSEDAEQLALENKDILVYTTDEKIGRTYVADIQETSTIRNDR